MKLKYTQNWQAYNKAQQREKALFLELLADLCSGLIEPEYRFGRPRKNLRDMVFCTAFKVYSLYSGRRFTSDMKFARKSGFIHSLPHYNSLFRYFNESKLTPLINSLIVESSLPLNLVETDFAVDSSGFSLSSFKRWSQYRVMKGSYHDWVKAHIMCGVKTNIVTAAFVIDGRAGDVRQFVPLVNKTKKGFRIREVSADKAYPSRKNVECVKKAGGTAYIPFRRNMTGVSRGSILWSELHYQFTHRKEEFYQHYHKRSNVESTFHAVKSKFGSNVRSKNKTAQHNEVLLKLLCFNICTIIKGMEEFNLKVNYGS